MWLFVIAATLALLAIALRAQLRPSEPATPPRALSGDERTRLVALMADGEKIAAIKLHREWTGAGLAASKHVVETL